MKRFALIAGVSLIAVTAVLYAGDWLVLRFRSRPFDTVTVQHYYAIEQKSGRIELRYDRTSAQQCTRSLFPHRALQPCWFLRRHTEQWTKI
ncbi:MAG TPA: hypothetical protein VFU86_08635 [Terriglobales bacterium]|nr:hypothetical protein [Terriglobales bacterium]